MSSVRRNPSSVAELPDPNVPRAPDVIESKVALVDHLAWEEYFMMLAIVASLRSKDPETPVGCVLVAKDDTVRAVRAACAPWALTRGSQILGVGYNGLTAGVEDTAENWAKAEKEEWVVHAEANALLHANATRTDRDGATAYVTLAPCRECAKLLVQNKVAEVVYLAFRHKQSFSKGEDILKRAGVRVRRYDSLVRGPRHAVMAHVRKLWHERMWASITAKEHGEHPALLLESDGLADLVDTAPEYRRLCDAACNTAAAKRERVEVGTACARTLACACMAHGGNQAIDAAVQALEALRYSLAGPECRKRQDVIPYTDPVTPSQGSSHRKRHRGD